MTLNGLDAHRGARGAIRFKRATSGQRTHLSRSHLPVFIGGILLPELYELRQKSHLSPPTGHGAESGIVLNARSCGENFISFFEALLRG